MNIEVASQGSGRKVLEKVLPYLSNKQRVANVILDMIKFVQTQPKGGNTLSIDYINDPIFKELHGKYDIERKWYIDPSTTRRRAREELSLDGIV